MAQLLIGALSDPSPVQCHSPLLYYCTHLQRQTGIKYIYYNKLLKPTFSLRLSCMCLVLLRFSPSAAAQPNPTRFEIDSGAFYISLCTVVSTVQSTRIPPTHAPFPCPTSPALGPNDRLPPLTMYTTTHLKTHPSR